MMTRHVISAEPTLTALEAAKIMAKSKVGCVVVLDDGKTMGIVTERDMLVKVTARGKAPSKVKVSEIMSSPVITIDPNESIRKAARLMREHDIRRLVVVKGGKLRGIVTIRDITDSIVGAIAEVSAVHDSGYE